jgi:hypothetical protein
MKKSGQCIVCGRITSDRRRPFGVLTEPVWCHHQHSQGFVQRAWMLQNKLGKLELFAAPAS